MLVLPRVFLPQMYPSWEFKTGYVNFNSFFIGVVVLMEYSNRTHALFAVQFHLVEGRLWLELIPIAIEEGSEVVGVFMSSQIVLVLEQREVAHSASEVILKRIYLRIHPIYTDLASVTSSSLATLSAQCGDRFLALTLALGF